MNSRYALGLFVTAALLTACGGSQPGVGVSIPTSREASLAARSHALAALSGIYVSTEYSQVVLAYPEPNKRNKPPVCIFETGPNGDVAADDEGNLMVTEFGGGKVLVFKGPGLCGPQLGSFTTNGDPVDVASEDAATGKIVVGNMFTNSKSGTVAICTLAAGCSTQLGNPNIVQLFGVALDKEGDCWASATDSASDPTLTYFKGCAGPGRLATGFKNASPGGLDMDSRGNLVSISEGQGFFVYKGCKPACKLLGGPFPSQGAAQYGHLNKDSTAFATADFEYKQVDIYRYSPTNITYAYSFDNGLSSKAGITGATFTPR